MIKSYLASALFMILGVLVTGAIFDATIYVLNLLISEGIF